MTGTSELAVRADNYLPADSQYPPSVPLDGNFLKRLAVHALPNSGLSTSLRQTIHRENVPYDLGHNAQDHFPVPELAWRARRRRMMTWSPTRLIRRRQAGQCGPLALRISLASF